MLPLRTNLKLDCFPGSHKDLLSFAVLNPANVSDQTITEGSGVTRKKGHPCFYLCFVDILLIVQFGMRVLERRITQGDC